MLAEGNSNKQVALKLELSPKTVDYHRQRILDKMKLDSVVQLARFEITANRT